MQAQNPQPTTTSCTSIALKFGAFMTYFVTLAACIYFSLSSLLLLIYNRNYSLGVTSLKENNDPQSVFYQHEDIFEFNIDTGKLKHHQPWPLYLSQIFIITFFCYQLFLEILGSRMKLKTLCRAYENLGPVAKSLLIGLSLTTMTLVSIYSYAQCAFNMSIYHYLCQHLEKGSTLINNRVIDDCSNETLCLAPWNFTDAKWPVLESMTTAGMIGLFLTAFLVRSYLVFQAQNLTETIIERLFNDMPLAQTLNIQALQLHLNQQVHQAFQNLAALIMGQNGAPPPPPQATQIRNDTEQPNQATEGTYLLAQTP